jgi:hypothetical protein
MEKDPLEEHDIAAQKPEVVAAMRKGYETWFKDVGSTRGYDPVRLVVGSKEENPVLLTRQDWRGPRAGWAADSLGHWEIQVALKGTYQVQLLVASVMKERAIHLRIGGKEYQGKLPATAGRFTFMGVELAAGPTRLEAWIDDGTNTVGVLYAEVGRNP